MIAIICRVLALWLGGAAFAFLAFLTFWGIGGLLIGIRDRWREYRSLTADLRDLRSLTDLYDVWGDDTEEAS